METHKILALLTIVFAIIASISWIISGIIHSPYQFLGLIITIPCLLGGIFILNN